MGMPCIRWALCLTFLLPFLACEQTVNKGDDKLTEGRQQILVTYKGSTQTVYFDNLETAYPVDTETPVVFVDDIVLGSGLITHLDGVWLNFVGADGFTPIGVCPVEYAPTPGEVADRGYIERGTTRLIWDESLAFERCMSVQDVVSIEIADDPEDFPLGSGGNTEEEPTKPTEDGLPFEHVLVHFGGNTTDVNASEVETSVLQNETVILVSTILVAAQIEGPFEKYTIDFEGTDGYRPSQKGTCEEYLPAPGNTATHSGIHVDTSELVWLESLGIEKCAWVKLVGHIYVE